MRTLQQLLVILDGQKLTPGYLPVLGDGTALGHVIALMQTYDPRVTPQTPIPFPPLLFTPAWIGSLAAGQDAIFLEGVDGKLANSNSTLSATPQPAYLFTQPV